MGAEPKAVKNDYKVRDISLADWGRREITIDPQAVGAFVPDIGAVFYRQAESLMKFPYPVDGGGHGFSLCVPSPFLQEIRAGRQSSVRR